MEGTLTKSLPLVAAVLGKQLGVRVEVCESSTACTNGRTIFIPAIKEGPEELELVRGFIDHEAAHIRSTNFVEYRIAPLDKTGFFLLNALEDWRVERQLVECGYRGCQANLEKIIRRFFCDKEAVSTGRVATDVCNHVLLEVRSWSVPEVSGFNRIVLPSQLKSTIDAILAEVRSSCSSTEACVDYARRIAEAIRDYEDYEKAEGKAAPEEESGQSEGSAKGKKGGKGKKEKVQTDDFSEDDADLLKNLGDQLKERIGSLAKASCCSCVLTPASDRPQNPLPFKQMEEHARTAALLASAKLRGRLRTLLETRTRSEVAVGRRGRKLDVRSLYRVGIGDGRIFRSTSEAQGLDTRVVLAIDSSGSMRQEGRVEVAFSSAYAVAEALRGIRGVSLEGIAFPGGVAVRDSVRVLDLGSRRWLVPVPAGGTPLGPCWAYLAQRLACASERRRIVITISDGVPDDDKAAREGLELLKAVGAEVLGVGIGEEYFGRILPAESFCVVENVGDLPASLFGLLEKNI